MLTRDERHTLSAEVIQFAKAKEDCRARWLYCLSRVQIRWVYDDGSVSFVEMNERAVPACNRFLNSGNSLYRLRMLGRTDATYDSVNERLARFGSRPLDVGPMQPWLIGHVYFLRVTSHPHVFKVGFSRRVEDRIADLQSTYKTDFEKPITRVGTQADEVWWHRAWHKSNISGEWFYDPKSTNRSLPDFLQPQQEKAA